MFNLAPGGEEEDPPVVVACPKNNDATRPDAFALKLNTADMTYRLDPEFNLEAWLEEVRDRAKGKRSSAKAARQRVSEEDALALLRGETDTAPSVRRRLREAGATRDEADDLVKRLVDAGKWEQWRPPGRNPPVYIGPEAAMKVRREKWLDQHQPKLEV